ncbi:MAG: hypothetical protein ACEY3B_02785 [Wolbachia sp.]
MFFQQHPNPFVSVIDQNIEVLYKLTHILVLYGPDSKKRTFVDSEKNYVNWRYKRKHKPERLVIRICSFSNQMIYKHCLIEINAVQAYREYYLKEKIRFAKWEKGREAPDWIIGNHCTKVISQ